MCNFNMTSNLGSDAPESASPTTPVSIPISISTPVISHPQSFVLQLHTATPAASENNNISEPSTAISSSSFYPNAFSHAFTPCSSSRSQTSDVTLPIGQYHFPESSSTPQSSSSSYNSSSSSLSLRLIPPDFNAFEREASIEKKKRPRRNQTQTPLTLPPSRPLPRSNVLTTPSVGSRVRRNTAATPSTSTNPQIPSFVAPAPRTSMNTQASLPSTPVKSPAVPRVSLNGTIVYNSPQSLSAVASQDSSNRTSTGLPPRRPVALVHSSSPSTSFTPSASPYHSNFKPIAAVATSSSPFHDNYENLGVIGQGDFGVVHKVRSRSDQKLYAVKESRRQFRSAAEHIRALKEVRNLELLSRSVDGGEGKGHPNIVNYHSSWEEHGQLYICMELLEHGTLRDALMRSEEPINEERIWSMLADLISGLGFMHAHHLVHLDLKPENIFLTADGHLKIGDFGVTANIRSLDASQELKSKVLKTHNLDDNVTVADEEIADAATALSRTELDTEEIEEGDATYLPPELIDRSLGNVGPAADIFSLGLMLFEIAADVTLPTRGKAWIELRNEQIDFEGNTYYWPDSPFDPSPAPSPHEQLRTILTDYEHSPPSLRLSPTVSISPLPDEVSERDDRQSHGKSKLNLPQSVAESVPSVSLQAMSPVELTERITMSDPGSKTPRTKELTINPEEGCHVSHPTTPATPTFPLHSPPPAASPTLNALMRTMSTPSPIFASSYESPNLSLQRASSFSAQRFHNSMQARGSPRMAALRRSNSLSSSQSSGNEDDEQRRRRPSVGSNRSAALRALICSMLHRKPSARPSILHIVAHERLMPNISQTQLANLEVRKVPADLSPIRIHELRSGISTPSEHEVKEVLRSPATPVLSSGRLRIGGSTGKRKRSVDNANAMHSDFDSGARVNNNMVRFRLGQDPTQNELLVAIANNSDLDSSGTISFCSSEDVDHIVYTNTSVDETNEDELSLECRPRRLLAELDDIE